MGEWKAYIGLRVRQDLRREMEEYAGRDRRKLGNVWEVLLEWLGNSCGQRGSSTGF